DTTQSLPPAFSVPALEQQTVNLEWKERRFIWKDADFEKWPLRVEPPPPADFATRILHIIGEQARAAKRVEVPFDFIAPPPERWWTGDSRGGVDVALGRAGA